MNKNKILDKVRLFGKSLLFPIAVLPIAAILLRFGGEEMFNIPLLKNAGNIIFDNLSLLFAIGISIGIADDEHGGAGMAGAITYLIIEAGAKSINSDINMGVFSGIISGIMAGNVYNKFKDTTLPAFLNFFEKRRFVLVMSTLFGLLASFILGYVFPIVQRGLDAFSIWILKSQEIGVFLYGALERIFVPIGFHHLLNSVIRFMMGEYVTPTGQIVMGDQLRFLAGDPTAGIYMAGGFAIMMFGLPGAALAIYRCAKPEKRKKVLGILIGATLTCFLMGITEPVEFLFIFISPLLFFIHAVFAGLSYALANYFGILHGFGFSAGVMDYILNYNLATRPLFIIPIGVCFFFLYYFVFSFLIKKRNYKTLGREDESENQNNKNNKNEK